jgi:hypothetical protein
MRSSSREGISWVVGGVVQGVRRVVVGGHGCGCWYWCVKVGLMMGKGELEIGAGEERTREGALEGDLEVR